MPNYYLPRDPDEITEDYLENLCGDLHCALVNVLDNDGDEEEYDKASELLRFIGAVLDCMMPDEES